MRGLVYWKGGHDCDRLGFDGDAASCFAQEGLRWFADKGNVGKFVTFEVIQVGDDEEGASVFEDASVAFDAFNSLVVHEGVDGVFQGEARDYGYRF
jgi:hypothetical protein